MASAQAAADLLATIVAATRRSVEVRVARESPANLERRASRRSAAAGRFASAVRAPGINVIAECKRRSPSKGVLCTTYDPAAIARSYRAAGAAAISVLTEPTFFDGAIGDLESVRAAVDIPVLRKDFVICEYQLLEARAAGADAVLLIVAALESAEHGRLMRRAAELGLDTLVEVHQEQELDMALEAGARLIGVNNRNLRTLEVDLHASEQLIRRIPDGVVAVSESGLRTPADLLRLRDLGYRAFLVGERFMTSPDPGRELHELLTGCRGGDLVA